jgi:hypothetical protein
MSEIPFNVETIQFKLILRVNREIIRTSVILYGMYMF